MKKYLLLATCLIFSGCGREAENQHAVMAKLDAIHDQVATKQPSPARWAFADKREIESAIFQYSRDKQEQAKKTENLSPETEAKVAAYEHLEGQLIRLRMAQMRPPNFPPMATPPGMEAPVGVDYATLSNQVAEARAPIADIIERRNRQSAQYRDEFSVDQLVAEYAKDRFDLVVDSSNEHFSGQSTVLYRNSGEAVDITDGVLKLLKEKTKL